MPTDPSMPTVNPVPPRAALRQLEAYPPGKPVEEVQREHGITRVIKLASNENPLGPSPKALEAIQAELPLLNQYPEGGCYYLRHALAQKLAVEPESLVFGNGSDEIVMLLALAYLEPGLNIVCSEVSFIRYAMGAQMMGAHVKQVARREWTHDVPALARACDERTRILFLANPDNPIGTGISHAELERLLAAAPDDVLIFIDEAYYEYACVERDYPKSLELFRKVPNLIVSRTFSKGYGLAGLRLGYALAHPPVVDALERVRPPFNVNRIAQAAAVAALGDEAHLEATRRANEEGKRFLEPFFASIGVQYIPTRANFFLVDLGQPAQTVYEALLREGVVVRPMGFYGMPNCIRVTIGTAEENAVFADALRLAVGSRSD